MLIKKGSKYESVCSFYNKCLKFPLLISIQRWHYWNIDYFCCSYIAVSCSINKTHVDQSYLQIYYSIIINHIKFVIYQDTPLFNWEFEYDIRNERSE